MERQRGYMYISGGTLDIVADSVAGGRSCPLVVKANGDGRWLSWTGGIGVFGKHKAKE